MRGFLLALQLLTVIPVKIAEPDEKKIGRATLYFPWVGLFLGLLLAGIDLLLGILNVPGLTAGVILVITLAALTGGMHLDGAADTADAVLSGKPKDEMLAIMRDHHIGAMGVLVLVSVILLKVAFLYAIPPIARPLILVAMCVLSRWSMVLAISLFPYARQDGKARIFINAMTSRIAITAAITTVILAFCLWQAKGVLLFFVTSGCAFLTAGFFNRRLGGLTGDTLGALCELNEIIVLGVSWILTAAHF